MRFASQNAKQILFGGFYMADIKNGCPTDSVNFKEAVCVDAGRVYDSCCEEYQTIWNTHSMLK